MTVICRVLAVFAFAVYAVSGTVAAESKATQPADGAGAGTVVSQLKTVIPVAGTANGEKWWRGNYERINKDIKKMDGGLAVRRSIRPLSLQTFLPFFQYSTIPLFLSSYSFI